MSGKGCRAHTQWSPQFLMELSLQNVARIHPHNSILQIAFALSVGLRQPVHTEGKCQLLAAQQIGSSRRPVSGWLCLIVYIFMWERKNVSATICEQSRHGMQTPFNKHSAVEELLEEGVGGLECHHLKTRENTGRGCSRVEQRRRTAPQGAHQNCTRTERTGARNTPGTVTAMSARNWANSEVGTTFVTCRLMSTPYHALRFAAVRCLRSDAAPNNSA